VSQHETDPIQVSLQNIDARIVWMLSGIAQRTGQRIGLHRDGDILGLPPFEAEIRRRLWWQIVMMEGFSQKLAGTGTGTNASMLMGDVKMPASLNDSDLTPGMKVFPKESDRATEMMFFLIRCHVSDFLKRLESPQTMFDGAWSKLTTSVVAMNTKEKAITELESLFERKYLRHCDLSIIWHFMCTHLAKAIIFMMRFMAYGAKHQGKTEPQGEKDALFTLALQVCSLQNLAYTIKQMHGFKWHIDMHFQWKAFKYVLLELQDRVSGPEVEQAWKDVQLTYDFHPALHEELSRKALPMAISNLALKAWEAYAAANTVPHENEPCFIQRIRSRQHRLKKQGKTSMEASEAIANHAPDPAPGFSQQPNVNEVMSSDQLVGFDWDSADLNAGIGIPALLPNPALLEESDWTTWDNLLVDFHTNGTSLHLPDVPTFDFVM
jgi:hypothetical protein